MISSKVKQMIQRQQIIIVGSADKSGLSNVSPRTSFYVDQDGSIYWLELFKHKTFRNFQKNSWCSIAIFDKKKLSGYQLKGKIKIISDKKTKQEITIKIIDKLTRLHRQRVLKYTNDKIPNVIKFTTKIVYSLNPNELADSPLELDADNESMKSSNMQW
ncbi:MAG: pyridoxamine 5'-phosphate oxidase family protein [Candidatus Nitrosotenuis sp.]|nr:MAG: pyridoxamine 5'-phosphate oxidase family protein [Candidatus Nitrosotenuis sp.]